MNFIRGLVIFFITLATVSALRINHPECSGSFLYRYISPKVGWVGFGYYWTEYDHLLHNMTVGINLATEEPSDPNYLGEINMLHFHKLRTTGSRDRWNVNFEVKFPRQNPTPDVTGVLLNGEELCNKEGKYTSSKPVKIRLFLEYNDYTKEQRHHAIREVATPAPTYTSGGGSPPAIDHTLDDDQNVECGTVDLVNIYQPLVLNGETITRGTWPWLVSIFTYIGPKLGFQCGSTLISRKVVLTAAHCFFDRYNRKIHQDDIILILGQYSLKRPYDKGTQIIYPDSVNIHSEYGKRTAIDSDIAIVVLAERVRYTTFIRPACLWKESTSKSDFVGLRGSLAGWGRDEHGNFYTELPKRAEVPVVSDQDCLRSNEAFPILTSQNTFCAGWRNGTDGPCNGDSGSGLLFKRNDKWVLRGIVSTALTDTKTSSCNLKEYTIFTDIVSFLPWIETFLTKGDE
ncbi:hypothetical protein DMENIID0001_132840 [Sergentomyia squamirostris]